MKPLIHIGLLSLILVPADSYSQSIPRIELDVEALTEELFAMQEEELDYELLYESLLQNYLNPLNLNEIAAEQLQSLYILTPLQINSFIKYRGQYGDLLTIYELQAIPDFDLQTIYRLLPFVTVEDGESKTNRSFVERIVTEKNAYFILRQSRVWQMRKGFTQPDTLSNGSLTSRYIGDPHNLYARFRIQHSQDFSLGFTLDKDSGEQFIWHPSSRRYGFNFLSYHFTLHRKGRWETLTVGDYRVQFGQGLVFGSGFSPGKGAETITTIRRSSMGLRPYTSAMEFGFFRGGAFTYSLGDFKFSGLYSNAPRDANIQSMIDTLENQHHILSSLLTSGYHRTATEISNKSMAREQNIGGNIAFKSKKGQLHLGINSLFSSYSQPFYRAERIYNQFEFRGKKNNIHSAYFSYNFQNHFFFGETARSKSGGMGTVAGMMSSLSPQIDISVLWRSFDRDFHSFYGNAFSEGSRPINEKGIYFGLQYRPSRKFSWSAYFDRFYFPWLRFRAYAPSEGYEGLTRLTYTPSRSIKVFLQVREEVKDRNVTNPEIQGAGYYLDAGKRRNYVTSMDLSLNKRWSIKSRVQFSSYQIGGIKTKGYAILQDVSGNWGKLRISGRVALFDTEDYENRQYTFEKNVLWAFSIPNYNGQGIRYYILGQYNLNQKLSFWGRWAKTSFTDRKEIGSGLQMIQGNNLTETTFQLRYQFNK